jgi:hypothetical protein
MQGKAREVERLLSDNSGLHAQIERLEAKLREAEVGLTPQNATKIQLIAPKTTA